MLDDHTDRQREVHRMLFSKSELHAAPAEAKVMKVTFEYADGHKVMFTGEAARAVLRWCLNGYMLVGRGGGE